MTQHMATIEDHQAVVSAQLDAAGHTTPRTLDRFPTPTTACSQGSVLVLAVGPFRDWLDEYMSARDLTAVDIARVIGRDEATVRGWFGVRGRDWRTQSPDRFVVHVVSELIVEHVGIALTGNPRLVPELYPHMAEPVCQRCGAPEDCDHLGHQHQLAA